MKYLVLGDIHFAAKGPGARKDSWPQDIAKKVEYVSKLAAKHQCDAILQLGDVFHLKSPSSNPHWLIQTAHDSLTVGGVPVLTTAGNHDTRWDRVDLLHEQPLGLLGKMRGIELVSGASETFPDVYAIPYLQDWRELPQYIEKYNKYREEHPEIALGVLITHASFFPKGQEPPYEYVLDDDAAGMIKHPTWVAHGHLHFSQGVREYGDVSIANYGAISRGSLHTETINRRPEVYILDTETKKHKTYKVPVKPPEEVFDFNPTELEKDRNMKMTGFLDGLQSGNMSVLSVDEMLSHIETEKSVDKKVREMVSELISDARS